MVVMVITVMLGYCWNFNFIASGSVVVIKIEVVVLTMVVLYMKILIDV